MTTSREAIQQQEHRRRVTRLLHVGIDGTELDAATRDLLARIRPGGVILFQRNVASLAQVARLTRDLHAIDADLVVSVDQEGGPVDRLRAHVPSMPSGMALGATGDPQLSRRLGRLHGELLAMLGVDWDLTPTCDQAIAGHDNAIGVRSFGADPDTIVEHAQAMLDGLESGGVLGCIKHFPGLGAATADSHQTLPVVATSRTDLLAGELGVFQRLVAHAPSVLVSHAYYTHLTTRGAFPATLSDEVSTALLRYDLGFAGLTVTDDMVMGALAAEEIGDACIRALLAGADTLLVCEGSDRIESVATALVDAERSGQLTRSRLDEAQRRTDVFLARIHALARPAPIAVDAIDELTPTLEAMAELARDVAERSVTCTRRGSRRAPRGPIVVLRPRVKWLSDECARPAGSPFLAALRDAGIEARELSYDSEDGDAVADRLDAEVAPSTWLLATSDAQRKPAVGRLAERLAARAPLLHLALSWPLDLEGVDVQTSVATYGCSWDAVRAGTDTLLGRLKPRGTLPIASAQN